MGVTQKKRQTAGVKRGNPRNGFSIEVEQEVDGRWLADVTGLPGVIVYGTTPDEAVHNAKALALRVLADMIEHGESIPETAEKFFEYEHIAVGKSQKSARGSETNRVAG